MAQDADELLLKPRLFAQSRFECFSPPEIPMDRELEETEEEQPSPGDHVDPRGAIEVAPRLGGTLFESPVFVGTHLLDQAVDALHHDLAFVAPNDGQRRRRVAAIAQLERLPDQGDRLGRELLELDDVALLQGIVCGQLC